MAIPAPVRADALSLELGAGSLRSRGDGLFLSWRWPAPPLFGRESYHESSIGAWSGPDANEAVALSRGARFQLGRYRLSASVGIGYVTDRSEALGTHFQFLLRVALGRPLGDYELSIAQRHYSNGQALFGWSGPNGGENFLGLELARTF